jgi:hypothetical protein
MKVRDYEYSKDSYGKRLEIKLHVIFDNYIEFQAYDELNEITLSSTYDNPITLWTANPTVFIPIDMSTLL